MSHVIDFVARRREPGHDTSPPDEGTVLSVLPMPGVDAALVIVGYVVPLDGGSQSARGLRLPQGVTLPEGVAVRAQDVKWPHGIVPVEGAELPEELVVDRASRAVRVDGVEIDLTYREFELLDYLCSAPGRVFNRRQLMAAIWDRYGEEGARTVDVHILRLRRKLGPHAGRIVTVRNVGYKYQPPRS